VSKGAGTAGSGVAYGVDIGGTKVLGVALNADDQIMAESRVLTPTGSGIDGQEVAREVAEVVAALDAEVGVTAGAAPPVGVGVPGMLDRRGWLCFSPNLPQGHGLDWSELLGSHLPSRQLVIENDANFAALAEHRLGASKGYSDVMTVTLGTGIGGGVIIGGRVLVGAHGFAGEIGHMVVNAAGPPCPCGRNGCWERYASGGGLGLVARQEALAGHLPEVVARAGGDPERVRGEDVSAAAQDGDAAAQRVLAQVGWWVGFGLANLACVVDPECFVLGGGLIGAGDLLLNAARAAFEELVEGGGSRTPTDIVAAAFGERAGAVGGSLAARQGGLW
jgi:glucokinase